MWASQMAKTLVWFEASDSNSLSREEGATHNGMNWYWAINFVNAPAGEHQRNQSSFRLSVEPLRQALGLVQVNAIQDDRLYARMSVINGKHVAHFQSARSLMASEKASEASIRCRRGKVVPPTPYRVTDAFSLSDLAAAPTRYSNQIVFV